MKVVNLMERLLDLEDQKMNCVLQGAEFKPELQEKMNVLDQRLEKFYNWYSSAIINGMIPDIPEPDLNKVIGSRQKPA